MKVLSLTQPWASLVAAGAKRLETRRWATSYRGPLGIHAAKKYPADARALCDEEPFRAALRTAGYAFGNQLPIGVILATCRLADCLSTDDWDSWYGRYMTGDEEDFGDYSPGRVAWVLEDIVALPEPIPARGSLGLWEYPLEVPGQVAPAPVATAEKVRVVHVRRAPYHLYIGRAMPGLAGSPLGNPFKTGMALTNFRAHFYSRPDLQAFAAAQYRAHQAAHPGETFVLACWCAPNPCHGDVIKAFLEDPVHATHDPH